MKIILSAAEVAVIPHEMKAQDQFSTVTMKEDGGAEIELATAPAIILISYLKNVLPHVELLIRTTQTILSIGDEADKALMELTEKGDAA